MSLVSRKRSIAPIGINTNCFC